MVSISALPVRSIWVKVYGTVLRGQVPLVKLLGEKGFKIGFDKRVLGVGRKVWSNLVGSSFHLRYSGKAYIAAANSSEQKADMFLSIDICVL